MRQVRYSSVHARQNNAIAREIGIDDIFRPENSTKLLIHNEMVARPKEGFIMALVEINPLHAIDSRRKVSFV